MKNIKAFLMRSVFVASTLLTSGVVTTAIASQKITIYDDNMRKYISRYNINYDNDLLKRINNVFSFAENKGVMQRNVAQYVMNIKLDSNKNDAMISKMDEEYKAQSIFDYLDEFASDLDKTAQNCLSVFLDRIFHGLDKIDYSNGKEEMWAFLLQDKTNEAKYNLGEEYVNGFIVQEMLYNINNMKYCFTVEQNLKNAEGSLRKFFQKHFADRNVRQKEKQINQLSNELKNNKALFYLFEGDEENINNTLEGLIFDVKDTIMTKYANKINNVEAISLTSIANNAKMTNGFVITSLDNLPALRDTKIMHDIREKYSRIVRNILQGKEIPKEEKTLTEDVQKILFNYAEKHLLEKEKIAQKSDEEKNLLAIKKLIRYAYSNKKDYIQEEEAKIFGIARELYAKRKKINRFGDKYPGENAIKDTKENAKENTIKDTKESIKENVKEDTEENTTKDVKENTKENAKENTIKDTKEGIKENVKEDATKNVKEDSRYNTYFSWSEKDIKEEINTMKKNILSEKDMLDLFIVNNTCRFLEKNNKKSGLLDFEFLRQIIVDFLLDNIVFKDEVLLETAIKSSANGIFATMKEKLRTPATLWKETAYFHNKLFKLKRNLKKYKKLLKSEHGEELDIKIKKLKPEIKEQIQELTLKTRWNYLDIDHMYYRVQHIFDIKRDKTIQLTTSNSNTENKININSEFDYSNFFIQKCGVDAFAIMDMLFDNGCKSLKTKCSKLQLQGLVYPYYSEFFLPHNTRNILSQLVSNLERLHNISCSERSLFGPFGINEAETLEKVKNRKKIEQPLLKNDVYDYMYETELYGDKEDLDEDSNINAKDKDSNMWHCTHFVSYRYKIRKKENNECVVKFLPYKKFKVNTTLIADKPKEHVSLFDRAANRKIRNIEKIKLLSMEDADNQWKQIFAENVYLKEIKQKNFKEKKLQSFKSEDFLQQIFNAITGIEFYILKKGYQLFQKEEIDNITCGVNGLKHLQNDLNKLIKTSTGEERIKAIKTAEKIMEQIWDLLNLESEVGSFGLEAANKAEDLLKKIRKIKEEPGMYDLINCLFSDIFGEAASRIRDKKKDEKNNLLKEQDLQKIDEEREGEEDEEDEENKEGEPEPDIFTGLSDEAKDLMRKFDEPTNKALLYYSYIENQFGPKEKNIKLLKDTIKQIEDLFKKASKIKEITDSKETYLIEIENMINGVKEIYGTD